LNIKRNRYRSKALFWISRMDATKNQWNTLTLNQILNKVDLNNFQTSEDETGTKKKTVTVEETQTVDWQSIGCNDWKEEINITYGADPSSAYLGPKLWDKTISIPLFNDEMEVDDPAEDAVVSFEKFIKDNNLGLEVKENKEDCLTLNVPVEIETVRPPRASSVIVSRPSLIVKREPKSPEPSNELPKGDNDFLYAESKKAKLEREKAEKRRRFEESLGFDSKDLQLATVPGQTFDPTKRSFDIEELRPQPIVRKRKRTIVPEQEKDDQYWDKRIKNNIATKRAREAKRLKENQIALRAAFLEKENERLKEEMENMRMEHTKVVIERDLLKHRLTTMET